MISRPLLKVGVLLTPLLLLYGGLHLFGRGLTRVTARLFSGSGLEAQSRGSFTVFARKGSGRHDVALRVAEEFTEQMSGILGFQKPPSNVTIYLLDHPDDLERAGLTRVHADLANNGGYVQPPKLVIALLWSPDRAEVERGLRHLLLHLAARERTWPVWLHEGLASYYENTRAIDGGVRPGAPRAEHARRPPLPLRSVVTARASDFSGSQNSAYYDSSHLLVAYLLEKDPARLQEAAAGPEAFEQRFDVEKMEADWLAWIRELKQ